MLSSKMNGFQWPKHLIGYVDNYCIKQTKSCFCRLTIHNDYMNSNKASLFRVSPCSKNKFLLKTHTCLHDDFKLLPLFRCSVQFCTKAVPKNTDIFGDISNEQYERIKMDIDEQEEEEFAIRAHTPKWEKFTYNDYCKMIKDYIEVKDLKKALYVLTIMKENGVRPTRYMYRCLLSAFAHQGDIIMCQKLFRTMKDRSLSPTPSVYTSLITACSNSKDRNLALKRLQRLRTYFYEKSFKLNEIHYIALIKAYSWLKDIDTAFEIADEAMDNGIRVSKIFPIMFHAAISDEENGLKHALSLWHKMKMYKCKPTITHYNLLLGAIRDTKLGDLKSCDMLIPGVTKTLIQISNESMPNLLASPPILSTSVCSIMANSESNNVSNENTSEICIPNKVPSVQLNTILRRNRLILFGGFVEFLNQMKSDGVKPNIKTVTLLLQVLPPTYQIEEQFFSYIKKLDVEFDISFFNMLIKRRCTRKQYIDAKDVLNTIQAYNLVPNIITFGVLAIGCHKYKDGIELLEQMDTIGYAANNIILETLLHHACYYNDFNYILHIMQYLVRNQIRLSKNMVDMVDSFRDRMASMFVQQDCNRNRRNNRASFLKENYNKFEVKYEGLLRKLPPAKDNLKSA